MGISYKPLFRTLKRKSMTWTEICEELRDFYGISMPKGTKNAMQKGEFLPLELIGNIWTGICGGNTQFFFCFSPKGHIHTFFSGLFITARIR